MLVFAILLLFGGATACIMQIANTRNERENDETTNNEFKKKQIIVCALYVAMMILIFSLRSTCVGTDTPTYAQYYSTSRKNQLGDFFEFGFELLIFISKVLNLNFNGFLFIVALAMFLPVYFSVIKCSKNPILSLFAYSALGVYSMSFNGMRQFISFSLFLVALHFIIKGGKVSFLKYVLIITVAVLFHSSAIVLYPVYFLRFIKLNIPTMLIFVALAMLGLGLIKPIVRIVGQFLHFDYYDRYFSSDDFLQSISFFNVVYCMIMLCVFVYFRLLQDKIEFKNDDEKKKYNLFLILFFLFLIIRCLATFSNMFSLLNRFNLFFQFSLFFLLPYASIPLKNTILNNVFESLISMVCVLYFVFSAVIRKSNNVYPYDFFFTKGEFGWIAIGVLILFGCAMLCISLISFKRRNKNEKNLNNRDNCSQ